MFPKVRIRIADHIFLNRVIYGHATFQQFLSFLLRLRTGSCTIVPQFPPHQGEEDPAAAEQGKEGETCPDTHEKLGTDIRCNHETADEERDDYHRNTHGQHLADKPHCAQGSGSHTVIRFCHRTHDRVGVWRREESKAQPEQDKRADQVRERCVSRKEREKKQTARPSSPFLLMRSCPVRYDPRACRR